MILPVSIDNPQLVTMRGWEIIWYAESYFYVAKWIKFKMQKEIRNLILDYHLSHVTMLWFFRRFPFFHVWYQHMLDINIDRCSHAIFIELTLDQVSDELEKNLILWNYLSPKISIGINLQEKEWTFINAILVK